MILIWLGIGLCGSALCLVGSGLWGRKRKLLDEGKI